MKDGMKHTISRRGLFKIGGVAAISAATAGTLIGCNPSAPVKAESSSDTDSGSGSWSWETIPDAIPDSDIAETIEHEFIIVGAGIAGVATACALAENGADVLVLEKNGTYSFRGGHYGSLNNSRWRSAGVENDIAEVAKAWIAQCNSRCKEPLVWKFLENSGEAMDWAIDKVESHECMPLLIDAVYKGSMYEEYRGTMLFIPGEEALGSATSPDILTIRGDGDLSVSECVIFSLCDDALSAGAQFVFNAPAQQLVKEADKVTGVITREGDVYKKYIGSKGVILATGDIGGDDEMCERYSPLMVRCQQTQYVPLGANTGDGQKMGMWIGAKMEDAPFSPMIHPQGYTRISHFFMFVNTLGHRYMNEDTWSQGKSLGALTTEGNADHGWTIFDANWLNQIPQTVDIGGGMFWEGSGHTYGQEWSPENDQGFLDAGLENGMVKQADTFEELADLIAKEEPNFIKEDFLAEIKRYNELCVAGKDTDFGKRSELLFELNTPPFYAAKYGPCRMVAPGGLLINTNSQVLNEDDKPIEGLYAVGNVSGGLYAVDYPLVIPGNSHGRAVTFGYLLGKELTS
ncbi:FAD-dependent oxidoreductase [Eggerthella sp. YY7918]|uniref:FAD-dependent oxidoreductase n=1 Tax=Eggerthella sp. (strain YY7918) TaxID=502558 RepID=UPI0002171479|nr:FAD-dependent oxidoreductase [Eggerthella sp. YY7918]BAK45399.1 hypothetical protein EGYY_23280 [Eggerthella sp. YY7918]